VTQPQIYATGAAKRRISKSKPTAYIVQSPILVSRLQQLAEEIRCTAESVARFERPEINALWPLGQAAIAADSETVDDTIEDGRELLNLICPTCQCKLKYGIRACEDEDLVLLPVPVV